MLGRVGTCGRLTHEWQARAERSRTSKSSGDVRAVRWRGRRGVYGGVPLAAMSWLHYGITPID